jgi:hypothetical protein
MATAKHTETDAERYQRIRAEKQAKETVYPVPCECGMEWKAKRIPLDFWVTSGLLPKELAAVMMNAAQKHGNAPQNALQTMEPAEVLSSIEFTSKVVKRTAVSPRIVIVPTEPNDVSQEDVDTCCYTTLLNWQMQGGEEGKALKTFPKGR